MPSEFFDDWVLVAEEEAKHFTKWRLRLEELGGRYGEFPAHDSLWESAEETAGSLAARLAIVHCVHEARGLDTAPIMRAKLEASNDAASLAILERNHSEEIGHVGFGRKWLEWVAERNGLAPVAFFHALVRAYFRGGLRPPFNERSRAMAGFTPEWYEPLVLASSSSSSPAVAAAATRAAPAGAVGGSADAAAPGGGEEEQKEGGGGQGPDG
jgi:uncharacterized ferritin-like protein (DUF455 family)